MRTHVGQYRIEAPLGRGGMGVVYRGVHEHLGRPVAIKALAPELTQQPEFKERFFAEAKTQARLQHANIVGVYDLLEEGGEYFIVMEFVAGEPLDDHLRALAGRGMPVHEALGIFGQVLAALDYAHSEGVIHRDIKPSNVLITAGGRVKLTDFGIALLIGDKRLTSSQSAIGTPTYMSPEQILRPRQVDHRTDIYSAAVVFYEMLAGKPPFDDDTEYAIKKLHVEAPPPNLSLLAPGLPAGVVAAVSMALSKDPDHRFPSAGAFLRALQEASPSASAAGAVPLPPPVYRPTTLDSTGWTGTPPATAPTPPARPAAAAQAPGAGAVGSLQGLLARTNQWVLVGVGAVLALALGFGAFLLVASLRGGGEAEKAAAVPAANTAPADPAQAAPLGAVPAVAPPLAAGPPLAAAPTSTLSSPVAEKPQPLPEPTRKAVGQPEIVAPVPKPTPKKKDATKTPAPVPEPVATPAPVEQAPAAPAEPEETAQAPAQGGIDQFHEMEDAVTAVERMSKQALKAYEDEGREDAVGTALEEFADAAEATRKEFRKATGTGFRGLLQRARGSRDVDTRVLQVKVDDLVRRADLVDRLVQSSPLGPLGKQYWSDAKRSLKRLSSMLH